MLNKERIKSLLEKINWLAASFEKNDFKNISALEKSLLKEKLIMLYDEVENIPTEAFKARVVAETILTEELEPPVAEQKPKQELETKPIEAEIQNVEEEPKPEIKAPESKENIVLPENNAPISNTIVPPNKVEEKIDSQTQGNFRDMRSIIDLNKSFIFKADLFQKNNDLYNAFLDEINQTKTENRAQEILAHWVDKLNWETEENKAYDLLLRAVEKRFLPLI